MTQTDNIPIADGAAARVGSDDEEQSVLEVVPSLAARPNRVMFMLGLFVVLFLGIGRKAYAIWPAAS